MTSQTEKAAVRLSELSKRLLELAMRLKPNSVRAPRLGDKRTDGSRALPAISTSDELA